MHSKTHPLDTDLNSENHQPSNLCSHATLIENVSKGSSKMDQNGLLMLWTNQKDSKTLTKHSRLVTTREHHQNQLSSRS